MQSTTVSLSVPELRRLFRPFCKKYHIRRLDVFGSVARNQAVATSDVDLLVTFDDAESVSTADLLEMAGEAEELAGARVDFVVRSSLEKSPNPFARENILRSAINIYGG